MTLTDTKEIYTIHLMSADATVMQTWVDYGTGVAGRKFEDDRGSDGLHDAGYDTLEAAKSDIYGEVKDYIGDGYMPGHRVTVERLRYEDSGIGYIPTDSGKTVFATTVHEL